jgi:hypothetical protein
MERTESPDEHVLDCILGVRIIPQPGTAETPQTVAVAVYQETEGFCVAGQYPSDYRSIIIFTVHRRLL